MAKLSGYGHHGDPVALALAPLLVVEGAQAGGQPICPLGRKGERPPQIRRAVLRDRSAFQLELPGLVDGRVDAGVAHDGGGVLNLETSPISATIWAPVVVDIPGTVRIKGSRDSAARLSSRQPRRRGQAGTRSGRCRI